jgi:hypothetical protein
VPARLIYDNLKTVVDTVFVGKERQFNRRFLTLANHYLFEPAACTPTSGWEKGQVENQVGNVREWLFTPLARFASFADLNAWLATRCQELVQRMHPTQSQRTIAACYADEQPLLRRVSAQSVSWRVLRAALERNEFAAWPTESVARLHVADAAWREVLLGNQPHAGLQQQHMLPLDQIEHTTGVGLVPNINRYLMRAVQMDLCTAGESIFTFAKLGRFIIIGFVHEPQMDRWKGTKIHANSGIIEPRKYVVPGILARYLNEKADKMADALRSMSDAQHTKVDKAFSDNVDQYIDSDAYDAMVADIGMFGDAAFSKR